LEDERHTKNKAITMHYQNTQQCISCRPDKGNRDIT